MWLALVGIGLVAMALRGLSAHRGQSNSHVIRVPETSSSWSL